MGEKQYQIVITSTAERAYFEVLNYVFDHHSFDRANEIALELVDFPQILKENPLLGKTEPNLMHRNEDYRFLVYKRTTKMKVKIIYYPDHDNNKIYLTDFFPCEMNLKRINRRQ